MKFDAELNHLKAAPTSPAQRMCEALSLFEEGVAMQRLNLKRQHPAANGAQLESLLRAWLARSDEDQ